MDGSAVFVFFGLVALIDEPLIIITDAYLHLIIFLISTNSIMRVLAAALLKAMTRDGRLLYCESATKTAAG